jgi:hypothetical protein
MRNPPTSSLVTDPRRATSVTVIEDGRCSSMFDGYETNGWLIQDLRKA